MALSNSLATQFAKSLPKEDKSDKGATLNGTFKEVDGKKYVQLDGSDIYTPVDSLVEAENGERVKVEVKNHNATVTGNITSPAVRAKTVIGLTDQIDEFGNTIQQFDNTIEQQNNFIQQHDNAIKQAQNDILQFNNQINQQNNVIEQMDNVIKEHGNTIDSMNNTITQHGDQIESMNNTIESYGNTIKEFNNNFTEINNTIIQQNNTIEQHGNQISEFNNQLDSANNLIQEHDDKIRSAGNDIDALQNTVTVHDSDIDILNSAFVIKDGVLEGLDQIVVDALITNTLNAQFAQIDFANIKEAAVEKLFADSGIINDLVVKDGKITGTLVGVTIIGDSIQAGTLKADRLVVRGEDGLYYKLNVEGLNQISAEQASMFDILVEQPEDWETNWKDYYQIIDGHFVHITDEAAPNFSPNTYYKLGTVYENALDGSNLVAKSVTADKVTVNDLVAFNATIGGFIIDDDSIHSVTKGKSALNFFNGNSLDTEENNCVFNYDILTDSLRVIASDAEQPASVAYLLNNPSSMLGKKCTISFDSLASSYDEMWYRIDLCTYRYELENGKITKIKTIGSLTIADDKSKEFQIPATFEGTENRFGIVVYAADNTQTHEVNSFVSYIGLKVNVENYESISDAPGLYFDESGEIYFGNKAEHVKYYKDLDGNWTLDIRAANLYFGNSGSSVGDTFARQDSFNSSIENGLNSTNQNLESTKNQLGQDIQDSEDRLNQSINGVSENLEQAREDFNLSINMLRGDMYAYMNSVSLTFKSTGGSNLLRNSVGYSGTDFWNHTGEVKTVQDERESFSGSMWVLTGESEIHQQFKTQIGVSYSVALKMRHSANGNAENVRIEILGGADPLVIYEGNDTFDYWTTISLAEPYIASIIDPVIKISLAGGLGSDILEITDLIVSNGECEVWSGYFDEVYGKMHLLDQEGLRLYNLQKNLHSHVTTTDIAIEENNKTVAQLSGQRVYSAKGEFTKEYELGKLSTVVLDNDNIIEYININ